MSFEGFIVEYLIKPRGSRLELAMLYCEECGQSAPRDGDYMRNVCTEIRCPTCGNHAVRSSEGTPINQTPKESVNE